MKIRHFLASIPMLLLSCCFIACSESDDDNNGNNGNGNGNSDSSIDKVVINKVYENGWNGDMEDGVVVYSIVPEDFGEELQAICYAFELENGICKNAAFNFILDNESHAKAFEKSFNSGSWTEDFFPDDEYDDEYDSEYDDEEEYSASKRAKGFRNFIKGIKELNATVTRNGDTASFNFYRKGRILYLPMPHFVSLPISDIVTVVELVDPKQHRGINKMNFGNWNRETGIYTFNNGFCLNFDVKYKLDVTPDGYVKSYLMTLDCKNSAWAEVMYEMLDWALGEIQLIDSVSAKITESSGNIVTNNVTTRNEGTRIEEAEKMLMIIDSILAHPWIVFCFF